MTSWFRHARTLYLVMWSVTAIAAAAVYLLPSAFALVRANVPLALHPQHAHLRTAAAIAVHNSVVAGYPAALSALGLRRRTSTRLFFGSIIGLGIAANAALVGAALGAYGASLLAYLVHLPLEWAAVSAGAACWAQPSAGRITRTLQLASFAASILAAAATEVWLTPH